MTNTRRLGLMKPEAVPVDVSRGALVDPAALHDTLVRHAIGGAVIDVWYTHPQGGAHAAPCELDFGALDDAPITPRISGVTRQTLEGRVRDVVDDIRRQTDGRPPNNVVHVACTGERTTASSSADRRPSTKPVRRIADALGHQIGREFSSIIGGGIAPMFRAAPMVRFSKSWVPVALEMTFAMPTSFLVTRSRPETLNRDVGRSAARRAGAGFDDGPRTDRRDAGRRPATAFSATASRSRSAGIHIARPTDRPDPRAGEAAPLSRTGTGVIAASPRTIGPTDSRRPIWYDRSPIGGFDERKTWRPTTSIWRAISARSRSSARRTSSSSR